MTASKKQIFFFIAACSIIVISNVKPAKANPVPFYESRNDHYRTGANLSETLLNTSNVNTSDFGLLFNLPVDEGGIVTQTLYVPNTVINHYVHNVIYVTTNAGSIYAFDADQPGPSLGVLKPGSAQGIRNTIQNTPIIDPSTNTLYVVTMQTSPNPPYQFQLHALDIQTGAEKFNGPVALSATYTNSKGNTVSFTPQNIFPHAGLALVNGQLIITFSASNEDSSFTYSGWVLSYNATTLQQTKAFATISTPPATGGGIWQAGRAPAIDDNGFIYLFVGNAYLTGDFQESANGYDGVNNFSESLLKFDSNLNLIDWFTVGAWASLDAQDGDLSSSGPTIIPGTNLITGGGKDGNLYLWNTQNLGKYNANDTQVVQKIPSPLAGANEIFNGPVFWSRSTAQGGGLLFNVYYDSPIYAFAFKGGKLNPNPVYSTSAAEAASADTTYRTAFALSANGGQSGTGIIWALMNNPTAPNSVLHAYNAENLTQELWQSGVYTAAGQLQGLASYIPPTISNGKVYVPTYANVLSVFGLTNQNQLPTLHAIPDVSIKVGQTISYQVPATDADPLVYTASNLPPSLTINPNTGLISGAANTVGSYQVTFTVTDNKSGQRSTKALITVTNP